MKLLKALIFLCQALVLATRRDKNNSFHRQFGEAIRNKDKNLLLEQYPVLTEDKDKSDKCFHGMYDWQVNFLQ